MKPLIIVFFFLSCVLSNISAEISNLLCTKEFCEEERVQNPCKSLPKQCNSTDEENNDNGVLLLEPSLCNCCDYCLKYLEEGDLCVFDGLGQPLQDSICGPGLGCTKAGTCESLNTTCTKKQLEFDESQVNDTWGFTQVRPLCDARGMFHPVHCIGASICYCVSPEGDRIFGEAIYSSSSVPETMNCECSRAAWKGEQFADELGVHSVPIHCLEDGSYDLLQCIDDICRCLDPKTKTPDNDSSFILEINIVEGSPECFDSTKHEPGKYKQECEKELQEVLNEIEMLKEEGITSIGMRIPRCQYDGRYHRLMIAEDEKRCVDPDGRLLEDYVIFRNDSLYNGMDCNCARTHWLMKREGQTELPVCCDNGNFRQMQCRRGKCYCVDCNGDQLGVEVEEDNKTLLNCTDNSDACSIC